MTPVLLIGAGLLIHGFVRLTSASPGFELSGRHGVAQTVEVRQPASTTGPTAYMRSRGGCSTASSPCRA
jgi:hypothetical protein